MFDVIIVKADRDHVTRYVNEVIDTCSTAGPKLQIGKRSIIDTTGEKHTLKCKKLLFLLGSANAGMTSAVESWIEAVFTGFKDVSEKVLVVHESSSNAEERFDASEITRHPALSAMSVNSLKDVFQWFPHILSFIYKTKHTGTPVYLKTDVEMKRTDGESESIAVEQGKLKDDISNLLHFNKAELVDNDDNMIRCKIVVVVFGRDISISDPMYSLLRQAKINGVNVLFFFPHELSFERKIKRISNKRYTVSQHMEGILFLMRGTAIKKLKLPPPRKPIIPSGPLSISCMYDGTLGTALLNCDWFPYPYGLEETFSLQIRGSTRNGRKCWLEMTADIPGTDGGVVVQFKGRPSRSLSNYRLMCEDKDGNFSNRIKPNSVIYMASDSIMMSENSQSGFSVYKKDKNPAHVKCPFCDTEVDTKTTILLLGCIPCSCLPCLLCKDVAHNCPNCQKEVRRYDGLH